MNNQNTFFTDKALEGYVCWRKVYFSFQILYFTQK